MKVTVIAAIAAGLLIASLTAHAAGAPKPAKPSSYAPKPHSNRRVYGAPIQPPILAHRKHKKPATHTPRTPDGKARKPTPKPAS